MGFFDSLKELAIKAKKMQDEHLNEQATKQALVLPMIHLLGYNVWDPTEVYPEYTADFGTKEGEKVDYAILKDKIPIILIEAKPLSTNLDKGQEGQLYRYFSTIKGIRIGILTNGNTYKFFSDLEAKNMMDKTPFFEFDLIKITENQAKELERYTKFNFNLDEILKVADELKYKCKVRDFLENEFKDPSPELTYLVAKKTCSRPFVTQAIKDQFKIITKQVIQQLIDDKIIERLDALKSGTSIVEQPLKEEIAVEDAKSTLVTSNEEIEAFYIIKSILYGKIDVKYLSFKDTQNYLSMNFTKDKVKIICRLYLNSPTRKYVQFVVPGQKDSEKILMTNIDDLFKYQNRIIEIASI